jgi:hypothetical protein
MGGEVLQEEPHSDGKLSLHGHLCVAGTDTAFSSASSIPSLAAKSRTGVVCQPTATMGRVGGLLTRYDEYDIGSAV